MNQHPQFQAAAPSAPALDDSARSRTCRQRSPGFRLGYFDDGADQSTDPVIHTCAYSYADWDAANRAAPTLNYVRVTRGRHPYTHIACIDGARVLETRELEAAL